MYERDFFVISGRRGRAPGPVPIVSFMKFFLYSWVGKRCNDECDV